MRGSWMICRLADKPCRRVAHYLLARVRVFAAINSRVADK